MITASFFVNESTWLLFKILVFRFMGLGFFFLNACFAFAFASEEARKGHSIPPQTGARDGCEPPHGDWDPNLCPLQE